MLLTDNYRAPASFHQQQQDQAARAYNPHTPQLFFSSSATDPDLDLDADSSLHSVSSSPASTQSLLSQFSSFQPPTLSARLDDLPTLAVPRQAQQQQPAFFDVSGDAPLFD